jgi:hypothetical protein
MSSFTATPIRKIYGNVTITAEAGIAFVIAEPNYPGVKWRGFRSA